MAVDFSTSRLRPIDLPVLQSPLSSGIHELSRNWWPQWAASDPKFTRVWLVSGDARCNLGLTSPGIRGALLTERIDSEDAPDIYNYNIYLIFETTEGRHFQSAPIRQFEPAHHSSRSSSFEGLGSLL